MSNSIKFEHGHNKSISFNIERTGLSHIMAIGALALTRERNNGNFLNYATDSDGLIQAIDVAEEITTFISVSISALGTCMAHLDTGEVEGEIKSIGWLIAGLSDLSLSIEHERCELQYALDHAEKNPSN